MVAACTLIYSQQYISSICYKYIYTYVFLYTQLAWAICQLHVLPIVRSLGNHFLYAPLTTQTQCGYLVLASVDTQHAVGVTSL